MAVLPIGMSGEAGGYQIERSLRFNSADSAYLTRTPASAGNRRTWTWSGWVKLAKLSTNGLFSASNDQIRFEGDGKLTVYLNNVTGGYAQTAALYRDFSAWYHIVAVVDTTQATTSDRIKIYVNGQVQTIGASSFGSSKPIQNYDTAVNTAIEHNIGFTGGVYADQYLTDINFIDGQALTPSSFGETDSDTGVWKPKAYTGSYGTNGFYLKFADNSGTTSTTLGKDSSPNGNNWTPNNFSVTAGAGNDSLVDTPTPYGTDTGAGGEVRGNYCTLNPLAAKSGSATNGNLDGTVSGGEANYILATIPVSSGKWYWEWTPTSNLIYNMVGISKADGSTVGWQTPNSWAYWYTGVKYNSNTSASYGASFALNDIIGIALDMDAGTVTFYKNGVSQGTAYSGLTGSIVPYFGSAGAGATAGFTANFGQRPFAYTAPSGFKALCTQNLPTPTVVQGDDYFNTVLYTGTGATRTVTGVGFQPDWVWIKSRSVGTYHHRLTDAVRGVTKEIYSNLTNAEGTDPNGLTAFGSDGFTLGSSNEYNFSGATFVAWNWKANGSGVSNTAGTITSTVSANTTAGISIVTWTGNGTIGATVGHGLGVVPSMVIFKNRSAVRDWFTYHSAYPTSGSNAYILKLNLTDAVVLDNRANRPWGAFSSSLLTLGSDDETNGSGNSMVAYCFAAVPGFSAFGSYTGNGSTDGTFVYTGFRPRWIMFKRTDTAGENWQIRDTARDTYNVMDKNLRANLSDAETTFTTLDALSNGFKFRSGDAGINASGGTYIYAAFSQNPFKYSLAR